MLKIKDDIDLKELEKYGIKKLERSHYGGRIGEIYMDGEDFKGWFDICGYEFFNYEVQYELDTLYDLIKDGLVEKV